MTEPTSNVSANVSHESSEPETQGNRQLSGRVASLAAVVAVAYALFHLYTAGFGSFPNLIQRSIHVGFALVLVFLLYGPTRKSTRSVNVLDWICILVAVSATVWVYFGYDRFMGRQPSTTIDLVLGGALILVVMEAARRVIGIIFTALAAIALAYAFFGPYIPMPFMHRGMGLSVVIDHLYRTDMGLWGTTTHITATVVSIFIIFGSILLFSGGGAAFMNLALLIAGRTTGGPAKVSVVASSLFATVSGSAAANVAVTGTFSIPMMKRLRYDRNFAGAVEATASTGGQLMPPIMGAGAFIMAELLAVPYVNVMTAAIIPCLLFYLGVFTTIHLDSVKRNYAPVDPSEMPKARAVFTPKAFLPFLLPVVAVLVFLYMGNTPQRAGFNAVVLAVLLYLFSDLSLEGVKLRARVLLRGLQMAGYALILIAVLAATAQIIIGIIGLTGFGIRLSTLLIAFSGGELLTALVMAMVVALVLGMGMPTTGAYLVAASVLAPALTRLGVEPLQAHMFIFYFAILSAITPPVCAAVFVASGISQGPWFPTAKIAVRLGLVGFIVPFMFVYSPELLMRGNWIEVAVPTGTALIGVISLAAGTSGRLLRSNSYLESFLLISAALMMIYPESNSDKVGLVFIAFVVAWQYVKRRQERSVVQTGESS